jgi:hypothetical protein
VDADELYGLSLDRFVSERGALAKALRADGHRAEADQVSHLRKPSVAAWAVNQLVRGQRAAFAEMLDAGDALRRAQADVLAGHGERGALRVAGERERAAVATLTKAARGLLSGDGHELGDAIISRVGDTLHAAAVDVTARAQVRDGRLVRELQHVGFSVGDGIVAPPSPGGNQVARERQREERAGRNRIAREHAERRKAVQAAATEARQRADRAARELQSAEENLELAKRRLRVAQEALEAAQAEAETSGLARERAEEALENT